jgi:hypothetical protein
VGQGRHRDARPLRDAGRRRPGLRRLLRHPRGTLTALTWAELEAAAPEIAGFGGELLERFQFALFGTLTRDGSPRVSAAEAYVIDGHLLTNMMPRSPKALDLLRDPRVYVQTPVVSKDGALGELKLRGRALVLEDETLKRKLDDRFWELIEWRPDPASHYFEVVATAAGYARYGADEVHLRWRA